MKNIIKEKDVVILGNKPLSDTEKAVLADELTTAMHEANKLRKELADIKEDFKEKIGELQTEIDIDARNYRKGFIPNVEMKCELVKDFVKKKRFYYLGKVKVHETELMEEDHQMQLKMVK